ncbi:MAG: serine/threonine-protein phosphatase, partial [Clostridiales bacterium]|nr:serine/threonine-protein phosphatase [Clostridiales bacterium]
MNQDNFICDGKYREAESSPEMPPLAGFADSGQMPVFGVFDGMGGEECGDVAALLAAKGAAGITVGDTPTGDLIAFCRRANAQICGYADQNGISAMGTTAALLA